MRSADLGTSARQLPCLHIYVLLPYSALFTSPPATCNGIPTTTTTTTVAITTTSATLKQYVKLDGGLRCIDQQLQAVPSKEEYFAARALIGSIAGTINFDCLGFTDCIFISAAHMLLFGHTAACYWSRQAASVLHCDPWDGAVRADRKCCH